MNKSITVAMLCLFMSFSAPSYTSDKLEHNHKHNNAASLSELSLNHGKRWQMDEHTRTASQKMRKTFFDADHSKLENLKTLGNTLDHQLQGLIAGCTMAGEAHNQLHLFLNEQIPTVAALSKAENLKAARESAIKLKGQFESYQRYFE